MSHDDQQEQEQEQEQPRSHDKEDSTLTVSPPLTDAHAEVFLPLVSSLLLDNRDIARGEEKRREAGSNSDAMSGNEEKKGIKVFSPRVGEQRGWGPKIRWFQGRSKHTRRARTADDVERTPIETRRRSDVILFEFKKAKLCNKSHTTHSELWQTRTLPKN